MRIETNLAFNTRLYSQLEEEEAKKQFAADLASLTQELANASERINPFRLIETEEGKIISPEFGQKDIEELLRWETKADILESQATLLIRNYILDQEPPFIIVWISSPDEALGYEEGRLVVGIGKNEGKIKAVENYGICIDYSPEECLTLAEQLLPFSDQEYAPIESTEDLRVTPIFLRPDKNTPPLDFISKIIPLQDVWGKIASGETEKLKKKALKDAQEAAEKFIPEIRAVVNPREFIWLGAEAEEQMMQRGWNMQTSNSSCGFLNSHVLSNTDSSHLHIHIDGHGKATVRKSEKGVFAKKCPYCGVSINKIINPGYKCSCGKEFRGVC
ncbi:MAG: hypothetical protein WBD86_01925 [Microgenomates group bacterium]